MKEKGGGGGGESLHNYTKWEQSANLGDKQNLNLSQTVGQKQL